MSVKANVRQSGNVAIIDLTGRIRLGEGTGLLRNTIKDVLEKGSHNILINLENVSYIDSSGLGELVGAYATVGNRGGNIKLLKAQKNLTELLQVTKLYTVFEVFEDETAAVDSFSKQSASA